MWWCVKEGFLVIFVCVASSCFAVFSMSTTSRKPLFLQVILQVTSLSTATACTVCFTAKKTFISHLNNASRIYTLHSSELYDLFVCLFTLIKLFKSKFEIWPFQIFSSRCAGTYRAFIITNIWYKSYIRVPILILRTRPTWSFHPQKDGFQPRVQLILSHLPLNNTQELTLPLSILRMTQHTHIEVVIKIFAKKIRAPQNVRVVPTYLVRWLW